MDMLVIKNIFVNGVRLANIAGGNDHPMNIFIFHTLPINWRGLNVMSNLD